LYTDVSLKRGIATIAARRKAMLVQLVEPKKIITAHTYVQD
jgi:hypothetical protein